MFYVIDKENKLSIFDDDKELIDNTRILMPQLEGQYTLETDIVTAKELRQYPNKVVVDDIEINIDVPDYDEEGNPIMIDKEIKVPDYDEEGNIIGYHTEIIKIPSTHKETIIVKGLVLNSNYEQEQAEHREAEFNKAFFNTSLGYVRRAVTMANDSKKDFLSDLLPSIAIGVQAGQTVHIYTYDKPPFDEDVTDWTQYQHLSTVTPQFINECIMQQSADFAPINEE